MGFFTQLISKQRHFPFKGTSINHLKEVRLLITRYKPKAQCRDTQTSGNSVPIDEEVPVALR